MRTKILLILAVLFSLPLTSTSWAGSQASQEATIEPERIVKFAKDVEEYAASQRARAFIISRVGRPEKDLPEGIHYTHTAIAIYSDIQLTDGETVQGYAIHNLYQIDGDNDKSQLVTDYPVDFFWGVKALRAGIIIPTDEIQSRLVELISNGKDVELHNPYYSVIANPFNNELQNCTEHTLDLLNATIYQTTDKEQLKANERAYFTPQKVNISPLKLALGSMFMSDVTTRDHQGEVATTTFTSIYRYLDKYKLVKVGINFDDQQNMTPLGRETL